MPSRLKSNLRQVAERHLSPEQRAEVLFRLHQAKRPFLKARSRRVGPGDLDALAKAHGTDKSSSSHDYARRYQTHFSHERLAIRRVLEIGVGGIDSWRGYDTPAGGQSLKMWRDYFPNALIVGVDIHPKDIEGDRIVFEQGDQADAAFLRGLSNRYAPFDIVIDDGSHVGGHVLASFDVLWDAVIPGGFYVIEDLETAYDPEYGGGLPGTPGTAATLLKDCVDKALYRDDAAGIQPSIAGMHIYEGVALLQRAR